MHIRLYNNGTLLAPLKCGTRYLDKIFKDDVTGFDLVEFKRTLFLPNVREIVVRPPMEHLTSALHTSILTAYNNTERDKRIEIDLKSVIDEFCLYTKTDLQNTHWRCDMYETLYWVWRRNKNNINIIELKDLTSYLKKQISNLPEYDSKEYDFHKYEFWCSKDEIMLFIKTNYPNQWNNLMEQVENSNVFYNYLINKEVIEIKLI